MQELELKTVRQFYMETIVLSETNLKEHEDEKVYDYLSEKVWVLHSIFAHQL